MRGGMVAEKRAVCRSCRDLLQDPLDVLDEAHVEHLVGFVEDEEADVVELQRAAAHVVHDPAGRADDDLDAALQPAELPLVRLAAVDRQRLDLLVAAVLVQRLGDLDRQLARRGRISACTERVARDRSASMIGRPKAAVLPEPVCAWAMTSRPSSRTGMVSIWIGVGSS